MLLFVVIVAMLSAIYRKDPQCCSAPSYHDSHGDMDGQLFLVGLPSSYSLPSLEPPLPRLPSYESVRKKDRQRHIHMMIADRFGLNGPLITEPPPTYEESLRHSVDIPYNFLLPGLDGPEPADSPARPPVTRGQTLSLQRGANEGVNGLRSPL